MSYSAGGQKIGTIGGAALGTALGGPVGGVIGGGVGDFLGGAIGGLFGSSGPSPQQVYQDELKKREQAAYDQQTQLAQALLAQSQGQGPSLAATQLGIGLDQINRNAMTQAAGVGGNGGVLARYAAMNAGANASAQANQSAALDRIAEAAHARDQLAGVLGNQASESNSMYGTSGGIQNQANANSITGKKNDEDFTTNLLGAGLQGYAAYGAAKNSKAPNNNTGAAPSGSPSGG